jgi:hypothetical protein
MSYILAMDAFEALIGGQTSLVLAFYDIRPDFTRRNVGAVRERLSPLV